MQDSLIVNIDQCILKMIVSKTRWRSNHRARIVQETYNGIRRGRRDHELAEQPNLKGSLLFTDYLGERWADSVDVVQCKIVHGRTTELVFEKEAFGMVLAPDSDVAKFEYLEAGKPVWLERLTRESLRVGHD